MKLKKLKTFLSKNKRIVILVVVGSVLWSLTMIKSGLRYKFGYGFWGPNGHDGIWHIALSKSLSGLSFENPVFAGEMLKNYHLGFDLILAIFNKLSGIRVETLYFQIFPPIFAVLIGFLTYRFIFLWTKSKEKAFWATFFVYFSTSFGFIVTFLKDKIFTGESLFWSQQSMSTLVNPPFALSLIFLLAGLIFLIKKKYLAAVLFLGFLIFIKVYAGLLALAGLFFVAAYKLFKEKDWHCTKIFLSTALLSSVLFFSMTNLSEGSITWQPFWFLETMMSYEDRLGWQRFYSAMTNYKAGGLWFKSTLFYLVAFVIFLVGNMGIRIISFDYFARLFRKKIKVDEFVVFILSILVFAALIPMLFVQRGTPWNTIQFFYYFLFLTSILAGISFESILKRLKSKHRNFAIGLILIFALFAVWVTLQHYLPSTPPAKISNEEIEALEILRKQPEGVVLTYLFDPYKAREANYAPRPLYLYDSTAYVSAFSGKPSFLEDEVNLNIMGYDWNERKNEVSSFISNLDPKTGKDFLNRNNIKYLYLAKETSPLFGEELKLGAGDLNLTNIFENEAVKIYQVE